MENKLYAAEERRQWFDLALLLTPTMAQAETTPHVCTEQI